jgi:biopolymer transport protein TolQ
MGILGLLAESGPVAKAVLLLLLGASILCWAIIFTKWKTLKKAQFQDRRFLETFWNSKSIEDVYARSEDYAGSPTAAVFKNGVKEIRKQSSQELNIESISSNMYS